jgi:exopolyphosphatase/guanosine-5'-triphosphate,3'-diphosphate pyrophosphatase
VATIDIGTNSVLMLVAERAERGELRVVDDQLRVTRLGQGVDGSGALHPDAVRRTLAALQELSALARGFGAELHAVGTSALRDASNGAALLDPARELLGSAIEVLSGDREARLTFAGAGSGLGIAAEERFTLVDIGGGSTEIVTGQGLIPEAAVSLDVGSVRLTERHRLGAPASPSARAALIADVQRSLQACSHRPSGPLVGIAGTVTTLAAIAQGLERFDAERIHGSRLTRVEVDRMLGELAGLDAAALRQVPGLPADRADLVVAGASLVQCLMAWAGAEELRVSTGGIRVGLAREKLLPNGDFVAD